MKRPWTGLFIILAMLRLQDTLHCIANRVLTFCRFLVHLAIAYWMANCLFFLHIHCNYVLLFLFNQNGKPQLSNDCRLLLLQQRRLLTNHTHTGWWCNLEDMKSRHPLVLWQCQQTIRSIAHFTQILLVLPLFCCNNATALSCNYSSFFAHSFWVYDLLAPLSTNLI